MIFLHDLIDKINNSETRLAVNNQEDCITIAPGGNKDTFLELFENCAVDDIKVYAPDGILTTEIFIAGICYKNEARMTR